ncbi:MAG: hypothetical protein CM15mP74_00820 [Halieaceae bacterium]|nr:MAG: hypothetical protein CM15mP74_00820 [Halieaceae bacterium]
MIAVLHRLQHFEPAGVFASDLRECLAHSVATIAARDTFREIAGALVSRHLAQLPTAPARQLARKLRTTETDLEGAIQLIRSLDPTPEPQSVAGRLNT